MNEKERLIKARVGLVFSSPFYASIALRLRLVEDKTCKTAYTDSVIIGYNPEWTKALSMANLIALICHEVLHIAFFHPFRKGARDHERWNVACDYAINLIVAQSQYILPKDGLVNEKYKDLPAEVIYNMLPDKLSKETIAEGLRGECRLYKQDKGIPGYKTSVKLKKDNIATIVAMAANVARMQGKIPQGLDRLIEGVIGAKISWKEILSRFMIEKSKNDYSWKQPNRRYLYSKIYLPKLESPCLGEIVIMVDTSGSVCRKELAEFASEIRAVLMIYPETTIKVLYIDSAVSHVEDLDVYDFALKAKGGGGTDFRPGFAYLNEKGITPTLVMYFTDGYCNLFPEEQYFPVLWVLTGRAGFNPPFGESIYIDKERVNGN